MANLGSHLVNPAVFEDIQTKIDDDTKIRDQLRDITQALEKKQRYISSALTNVPTLQGDEANAALEQIRTKTLQDMIMQVQDLARIASQHPYYKFDSMWNRQMQEVVFAICLVHWYRSPSTGLEGELLTIEQVGSILEIPVNVKDRDQFHLTIEEYLHALIMLIDELARVARISVTCGNFRRPVIISQFAKDLHAGFQILNLKNDSLRRRSDSIKYKVREIEDVIYDLTLRGLLPKA